MWEDCNKTTTWLKNRNTSIKNSRIDISPKSMVLSILGLGSIDIGIVHDITS